eukprot:SAG11_NODE_35819_length_264_cov_30.830303_1_plen_50_part_01
MSECQIDKVQDCAATILYLVSPDKPGTDRDMSAAIGTRDSNQAYCAKKTP